jgi:hypothetical protein
MMVFFLFLTFLCWNMMKKMDKIHKSYNSNGTEITNGGLIGSGKKNQPIGRMIYVRDRRNRPMANRRWINRSQLGKKLANGQSGVHTASKHWSKNPKFPTEHVAA